MVFAQNRSTNRPTSKLIHGSAWTTSGARTAGSRTGMTRSRVRGAPVGGGHGRVRDGSVPPAWGRADGWVGVWGFRHPTAAPPRDAARGRGRGCRSSGSADLRIRDDLVALHAVHPDRGLGELAGGAPLVPLGEPLALVAAHEVQQARPVGDAAVETPQEDRRDVVRLRRVGL